MKILALDFSSPRRSAAVGDDRNGIHEIAAPRSGPEMRPFDLIESALRAATMRREDIEVLAVGIGPGSYTGIRVAIALAQGWHLATGVKLLGINSVECMAAQIAACRAAGAFQVVVDAQRGEFYRAGYVIGNGMAQMVAPLKISSRAEVEHHAHAGDAIAGPDVTRWFPQGEDCFPSAATLVRLAATRMDFVAAESLAPIYLRETAFVKGPTPQRGPV
ncbi:MAG TPA: tRNA (adenosine(37)-N6)-threonylcarbamoyltransferase complex dimerization subunit type 1 TsaB [Verrucomicrobiota bacterium]|nr:tRNA (adenosine(37)-N6)-threonylcarbamoyltransferase complex dimerization subunit type 1 TsaB [Verrucomicrobiota bacterium]HNT13423.1 tRNA (adenosine(37)-N6)-threonylcarbamoyltransferase complex dimerization subunit type 1 TsaB [Verrucomicrobiota bacterium]